MKLELSNVQSLRNKSYSFNCEINCADYYVKELFDVC